MERFQSFKPTTRMLKATERHVPLQVGNPVAVQILAKHLEEAAASGQQDEFEEAVDNSEFAQEQAAQDKLDIIYSTEDIKWGNSIRKTTSNTILGVSTQMNARRLLELQEAAVKNKGLLIRDALMVVPVFLEDGTPVACISHLITNVACSHLLGGLRPPSDYHVPKNIECMRLMADALAMSLLRVQ
eukprot:gene27602-34058_t